MSVTIISDGTAWGTKVTNSDGVEISGITNIDIDEIVPNKLITATIKVEVGILELKDVDGKMKGGMMNELEL